MKRSIAQKIHYSMLSPGVVYRVSVPALGTINAKLVDKASLTFEVTDGYLQSQADKKKRWNVGQTFEAIPGMFEAWEIQ